MQKDAQYRPFLQYGPLGNPQPFVSLFLLSPIIPRWGGYMDFSLHFSRNFYIGITVLMQLCQCRPLKKDMLQ